MRSKRAWIMGLSLIVVAVVVYGCGCALEFEYPFWPTLWLASRTKTPDGQRVADLIRIRSGSSYVEQHWHHCTWCDVVYPDAPHLAVKVTINDSLDDKEFYLFDWEVGRRRLLPITVRTAKLFPELIPKGFIIEPRSEGLKTQLYNGDEPCRIIAQSAAH